MPVPLGKPFDCKQCGMEVQWAVSKNDKKYLATVKNWEGDEVNVRLAFYPSHQCDPNPERVAERLAYKESVLNSKLTKGLLIKGQTVTVVKGRKVAKGTTGIIIWVQESPFADCNKPERVGIKDAEGNVHFTAATNVVATNQLEVK